MRASREVSPKLALNEHVFQPGEGPFDGGERPPTHTPESEGKAHTLSPCPGGPLPYSRGAS